MQTLNLLRSHPQHQPSTAILRAHFDRHYPLLWPHRNRRNHFTVHATCTLAQGVLPLPTAHSPWQQRNTPHKKHNQQQGLHHALVNHDSPFAGAPKV